MADSDPRNVRSDLRLRRRLPHTRQAMTFLICSLLFIAGLFLGFIAAMLLVMAQDND